MEQNFETIWRMAKAAGGIDATVKYVETAIATLQTFTFRNTSGKVSAASVKRRPSAIGKPVTFLFGTFSLVGITWVTQIGGTLQVNTGEMRLLLSE